jgi:hypothetical protein
MKLRIKGNSLRFRLTRSEVAKLMNIGRIEETVYFGFDEQSRLTYALEHEPSSVGGTLRYQSPEVVIVLPTKDAETWAESDQVGIYTTIDLGPHGALDLIVEKDFACLDASDVDNVDTFANPNVGIIC